MNKRILIEVEPPRIVGGQPVVKVTSSEMTTIEGIALCNAGIAYFLQMQAVAEHQEAQAKQGDVVGPNGLRLT